MLDFVQYLFSNLLNTLSAVVAVVAGLMAINVALNKKVENTSKKKRIAFWAVIALFVATLLFIIIGYVTSGGNSTDGNAKYTIRISSNTVHINEEFQIYIDTEQKGISSIKIHAEAPSGNRNTYEWMSGKRFYIDTEIGTWKIWASFNTEGGLYEGNSPDEFATLIVVP